LGLPGGQLLALDVAQDPEALQRGRPLVLVAGEIPAELVRPEMNALRGELGERRFAIGTERRQQKAERCGARLVCGLRHRGRDVTNVRILKLALRAAAYDEHPLGRNPSVRVDD